MDILKDILMMNKTAMMKTLKSLKKNWIIIFTGLVYISLNMVIVIIVNTLFRGILSILAGFIMVLVSSALISHYLYLLSSVIKGSKINMNHFKDGFTQYLRKIYGVLFIAWLSRFVLSLIGGMLGMSGNMLSTVVGLVILVALNPLPETIYQKHYSSGDSIKYTFEFMKENWFNWFLPNIIFSFILYLITGNLILDMFATHISLSSQTLVVYLIGQTLFSFMMIYRGHLFDILSTSTRRKRMYMNKFYN